MPLVLGIDEAGYGPLLGPLVVSASLWRVPPHVVDADWWQLLHSSVAKTGERGGQRLVVNDSKQVFDRHHGIAGLERPVLAFAHCAGLPCGTAAEFLAALSYQSPGATHPCPWYRDLTRRLPLDPARSAYAGAAQRLAATLAEQGVTCGGLRAEVVTEDRFNARLAQTRNKAAIVVEAVLRLAHWAGTQLGDGVLHVLVDRLGGRADYRKPLMDAFPDRHLHVLELDDGCSRYELVGSRDRWTIEFRVDGDQRYLPIALASMVAKYVRELLMDQFNAYWAVLAPDVRPTAGYYTDACRFLAEIEPLVARCGLDRGQFVRAR